MTFENCRGRGARRVALFPPVLFSPVLTARFALHALMLSSSLLGGMNACAAQSAAAPPARASSPALSALPRFDFTQGRGVGEWQPTHDVAQLEGTPQGMRIAISGSDPYINGPARDFPAGTPLWLTMRIRNEQAGMVQIFYFQEGAGPSEENSVRFPARAGVWEEARLRLPALGRGYRFRIDPAGESGTATIAWMRFAARVVPVPPAWPRPAAPRLTRAALKSGARAVRSGELHLAHDGRTPSGFQVSVAGQPVAIGLTRTLIGYMKGDRTRWMTLGPRAATGSGAKSAGAKSAGARARVRRVAGALLESVTARDTDGGMWRIERRYTASKTPGGIEVQTRVTVSQPRSVVFLPMLALLPGLRASNAGPSNMSNTGASIPKSFGQSKKQGLFAGLEYLENEPSSSQADLTTPEHKRQVPDSLKITFPLMAIAASDRYIGLIWEKQPQFSAVFDSPDRLFQSGGHVMGVLFPGSNGQNRTEGDLLPEGGVTLRAGQTLTQRATIIGGRGASVVPAVQQYVRRRGLPPRPAIGMSEQQYLSLAAGGWLDSKIRDGVRFRHAYWPGFEPQPAADAPLLMEWLALRISLQSHHSSPHPAFAALKLHLPRGHPPKLGRGATRRCPGEGLKTWQDPLLTLCKLILRTSNADEASRLREMAREAIAPVEPQSLNTATVSHVAYPVASLVYGHVADNARQARERARELLKQFEPDGSVRYRPQPGRTDYGRTHFAREANGLTAQVVSALLEAAAFSGDRRLIAEGLRRLLALDKFRLGVPRGAQTWEVPLHTPDILASAHLVRAYVLGYELTGERYFLDQARYWAWTGVPFVYLQNPTGKPVGAYATIAVLGATNWQAPVWLGQPVQWCGLVYADALGRLAKHDATGLWRRLADGITASGIQQTWKRDDAERQGLLPDFYHLRLQQSDGPAINPGTVQTNAIRLFNAPRLYGFHAFRANGVLVHAPGAIVSVREQRGRIAFTVEGWLDRPYYVLVAGLKTGLQSTPRLRINGQTATLTPPHQYLPDEGHLILQLQGKPSVEIDVP